MKKILPVLLLMLTAVSFTSCYDEDDEVFMVMCNYEWRVVESTDWDIFQRGDSFLFYNDGDLEIYGSDGFYRNGRWTVSGGLLKIRFSGYRDVCIEAAMPVLDGDYVRLECYDYLNQARYTLRMVRGMKLEGYGAGNYYPVKKK